MWGGKKPEARAGALLDEIYRAVDRPPEAAMEKLIALASKDAAARRLVVEALTTLAHDGGDETAITWLGVVCGELGVEGALAVLEVMRSEEEWEGDIIGCTLTFTLQRRVSLVLPAVIRAIHQAENDQTRYGLYEVIEGALLADRATKERLVVFARERWEVEKNERKGPALLASPLFLLLAAGEPDIPELVREARALCRRGDDLDREINDIEAILRGEMDALELVRANAACDWRASVRNAERLFFGE